MRLKIIIGVVLLIIVVLVVIGFLKFRGGTKERTTASVEITNEVLTVNQRPYLTLTSSKNPLNSQFDGKFFILAISNVPAQTSLDYELTYETATNPQGIVGSAKLDNGKYQIEYFFGTKSTKDYHFDTGVEFGKIVSKIKSSTNEYEIISDFRLQKINSQKTSLSDQKNSYELQIPAGAVSVNSSIISERTVGLPQLYSGKFLIDQPIAFLAQAVSTLTKPASLKIKVDKNSAGKVLIVGWDQKNNNWKEFETTFDPQTSTATAKVDLLSTYIVVEK